MASISISCPSCSATEGVVRNGKSTAGHQRYICSHCRKTWQLQFTYTASQAAVGKLTHTTGQWGYVGAKSRQRWLFYAYDRIRRTV
ncbi:IS1 family transposase, partial [Shigella sonnei]|nr:IS1 family transposase [Shigella sonnei]